MVMKGGTLYSKPQNYGFDCTVIYVTSRGYPLQDWPSSCSADNSTQSTGVLLLLFLASSQVIATQHKRTCMLPGEPLHTIWLLATNMLCILPLCPCYGDEENNNQYISPTYMNYLIIRISLLTYTVSPPVLINLQLLVLVSAFILLYHCYQQHPTTNLFINLQKITDYVSKMISMS